MTRLLLLTEEVRVWRSVLDQSFFCFGISDTASRLGRGVGALARRCFFLILLGDSFVPFPWQGGESFSFPDDTA